MGESVGEFGQAEIGAVESAELIDLTEKEAFVDQIAQEVVDKKIQEPGEKEATHAEYDPQKTAEILIAHYGDQWFRYGTYEGTIADILEQCSAIEFLLMLGPDEVMRTFDKYRIEKPETKEVEETIDEEVGEPVQDNDASPDEKAADIVEIPVPVAVPAKQEKVVKTEIVVSKEETSKRESVVKVADKKAAPVLNSLDTPTEVPVEFAGTKVTVEKAVKLLKEEKEPLLNVPTVGVVKKVIVEELTASEAPHELSDFVVKNEAETLLEDDEQPRQAEILELVEEGETSAEPLASIAENFESWQEIAEQGVVLEEFLTRVIDDIEFDEPIAGQVESEEFSAEDLEAFQETAPELYAMYLEVATIKESIAKLQKARTKEECETSVEEIIARVTELLRMLGYDNPEKIIRDFVYAHPLSSLNDLIEELEKTMRRRARFEILAAVQKKQPHPRHLSFGKLVLFVLGAFSPRSAPETLI